MSKVYIIFMCIVTPYLVAMDSSPAKHQFKEGISYQIDKFGNILPSLNDISKIDDSMDRSRQLGSFVERMSKQFPGKAILLPVSNDRAALISNLRVAGFKFRHGNDEVTEWIVPNGSSIPATTTAIAGARIIVLKGDNALVIEDKNLKGRLMFPGGSVDPQELAINTVCRELQEEVGLFTTPQFAQLIALVNRVKANQYGSSDYCHYYATRHFSGGINCQESEVSQAFWASISDIANLPTVHNLSISPVTKMIAQHIVDGCKTSQTHSMLDYRQLYKPEASRDQADLMTVDLFAQVISPFDS